MALKVTEKLNVPAVELVGAAYLPNNEDKIFQMLADDFGGPTEEDVDSRCTTWTTWTNPFLSVFRRLSEVSIFNSKNASIDALRNLLDLLLLVVPVKRAHFAWTLGKRSSIMFTVPPSGVRCAMSCEAIIHLVDGTKVLPLCALLAWAKDDDINIAAQQVLRILGQVLMACDQVPGRDSYRAFALCIHGTCLQLATATLSRSYIEELCQNKGFSQDLQLCRSEQFDLRNPSQRVEALRLIIGLVKLIDQRKAD